MNPGVGRHLIFVAMLLLSLSALAADSPRHLPTLATDPLIDGVADAGVWDDALELPLGFEVSPLWGSPIEASARVKLGRTDSGLQVLVVVEQSAPVKATAARHDNGGGDGITVNVQPDPDTPRVFRFFVNAAGATGDSISSSSGAGSPDWNGEWQSAAKINAHGYVIELSIPWSTLELGAIPVESIALSVERQLDSGRYERHAFSPIDYRQNCYECQFERFHMDPVSVADGAPELSTRWLPYAITSQQRSYDPYAATRVGDQSHNDAGLDALFQWRSGRKLLLTLNPDFSQVESDGFVSNINRRFAATYGERRPFFTEESGAFSTPMALLYTRAISDPSVGIQYITRRAGSTQAALLADDSVTSYLQGGQNGSRFVTLPERSWNAVFRSTTPFEHGQPSNWGSFVSLRSANGYSNTVVAADVNWQPDSRHQLVAQLAGSVARADSADRPGATETERDFALVAYHQYSRGHYTAFSDYSDTGPGFRADLGSLSRTGTRALSHFISLDFPGAEGSAISRRSFNVGAYGTDDRHGLLLDGGTSLGGGLSFANEVSVSASISTQASRDDSTLIRTRSVGVGASVPLHAHLSLSASVNRGTSPDYVNNTGGHSRSNNIGLYLNGLAHVDGYLYWTSSRFISDRPGAQSRVEYLQMGLTLHPGASHHVSVFVNPFRSQNQLDPLAPELEPSAFRQWQLTYTYEHSRFTRVIVGASRSEQGGAGIDGLQPRGELLFAKWVLEL
jgi:hypothetical protein